MVPVVDMHAHLYEFGETEVARILEADRGMTIVAVSDDLESLEKTITLHERFGDRIIPCAGFHPWSIGEKSLSEIDEILRAASRYGVKCVGEVGLDRRFVDHTRWNTQIFVFSRFLETARELDAMVNIHSVDAWRKTLSMLVEAGVTRAVFHWYTGPADLLPLMKEHGYMVSINPAVRIQEKHMRIALAVDGDQVVFESDGPYNYRGLKLSPLMVRETIRLVAEKRGEDPQILAEKALSNSWKLLR
ncbi:MAG: TatD family hydrolase [Desulfurococcales archaeon]|nr:TatD family hydrolase [Desulfurococcales archaeon]